VESHYENALAATASLRRVSVRGASAQCPAQPHLIRCVCTDGCLVSANDWLQPLTLTEEEWLAAYLEAAGGSTTTAGLPFLQRPHDFARTYLGVADDAEDFISTEVVGVVGTSGQLSGAGWPGLSYKNYSDALSPTASAEVALWGRPTSPTH